VQTAIDLSGIFDLQERRNDSWVGESPPYPWGRIYGGLVIAQALWAATQTVVAEHSVHSLHGYFILGGDPREPVRYEVDRIRDGRSFSTRRVVAQQSSGAIFNLSCSFQRYEDGPETQFTPFPTGLPDPEACEVQLDGAGIERADVPTADDGSRFRVWTRFPALAGGDQRLQACALAYASDAFPLEAVVAAHPKELSGGDDWSENLMVASLDHAMWFHRPIRADEWLLIDMDSHGILRTRGLSTGYCFAPDGQHIATIAQEGLIREVRKT